MWSGDVDAGIQWKRIRVIAHIWTCGQFDLVFHILIGGEWKLEQKHTLSFLELKPCNFCLVPSKKRAISLFTWIKFYLFLHKTDQMFKWRLSQFGRDVPGVWRLKKYIWLYRGSWCSQWKFKGNSTIGKITKKQCTLGFVTRRGRVYFFSL